VSSQYVANLIFTFQKFFESINSKGEKPIISGFVIEKTQYLIICCTDAQAQEFHNAKTLEMDVSFKMVAGQTSVFGISAWNETIQRKHILPLFLTSSLLKEEFTGIHTYIYAFTNVDTRWGYAVMLKNYSRSYTMFHECLSASHISMAVIMASGQLQLICV